MKVLLVNGSPHKDGETYKALTIVTKALEENEVDVEWFYLGTKPVRGCIACEGCAKINRCVFNDDVCNELIDKMVLADGIIIGTPVYFSGPNGALTAILDRAFYASQSNGNLLVGKPAAAVATLYRSGSNHAIDRINKYFTFNGMPIVSASYWAMKFGDVSNVPDDVKGRDTMYSLGVNMANMLKQLNK